MKPCQMEDELCEIMNDKDSICMYEPSEANIG